MLRSSTLKKKGGGYEDIHHTCTIQFLDDIDSLSVTYQKETKGQFIVDYACQHLDLLEKDYFGLYYQDSERQRIWLDTTKTVQKQLKGLHSPILYFAVKFYPTEPSNLKEEITRYQLFLQVKKDLLSGTLLCTSEEAIKLSGYIIQSELGDYDPEEHLPDYISQIKNLPRQAQGNDKELVRLHKALALVNTLKPKLACSNKSILGQNPAEAEFNFLKEAAQLGAYGMVPHSVVDVKGNNMHLGISSKGIATFQNSKKTHIFRWPLVKRFTFDGRMFIVKLFNVDQEDSALLMKRNTLPASACGKCDTSESQTSCGFKCPTNAAAKNLWKCAIEQQCFFNLKSGADAPKVVSSGGFFNRSSKFRFSGRSEKEVYSSVANITRAEPRFTRSPSNAELARTYSSLRSATLPASWRQQQQQQQQQDQPQLQQQQQQQERNSTPSLKNQLTVDMERSLDESGFYPSGPTLTDEVLGSIATPESSHLSPASHAEGSSEAEPDVEDYEEELCCVVKHPRCGERDDTLPHHYLEHHAPDCKKRSLDNGYTMLDDLEVCTKSRNVAASIEAQMIDIEPLNSSSRPGPDGSTAPRQTSRLSSLSRELDAQVADLRTRLETDLDEPEPALMVNGGRKHSVEDDIIKPVSATMLRQRPPKSGQDSSPADPNKPVERKVAPKDEKSVPAVPATKVEAPKKQEVKKPGRSWFPGWKFFAALLLLSILIVAVLVFEIQADYPVITDIRMMPEVEALRQDYYLPYRQATVDFVNQYIG